MELFMRLPGLPGLPTNSGLGIIRSAGFNNSSMDGDFNDTACRLSQVVCYIIIIIVT
jgi:hypothetical protein